MNLILNGFLVVVILIVLLCGVFGIWDTYCVYKHAQVNKDILKYKPEIHLDGKDNPTLSELQAQRPDVCAWLTVENTNIDYPVVQGKTNLEYINKDVNGEYSLSGSVFLDSRNKKDFTDGYSLLYAHHMAGESMFGILPKFQEKSFFETHRTGYLFTPECTYKAEIFACVNTDAFDKVLFHPDKYFSLANREALISYIKEKSVQYKDLKFGAEDRILGMSTCYNGFTNGRILLFGKLTKIVGNQPSEREENNQ